MSIKFAIKRLNTNSFSSKDNVDKDMRSKIIYKINCLDCDKFYIGKTKSQLKLRKLEHKLLENSSVHKHMIYENHRIDCDDIKIIDTARDDWRMLS